MSGSINDVLPIRCCYSSSSVTCNLDLVESVCNFWGENTTSGLFATRFGAPLRSMKLLHHRADMACIRCGTATGAHIMAAYELIATPILHASLHIRTVYGAPPTKKEAVFPTSFNQTKAQLRRKLHVNLYVPVIFKTIRRLSSTK